MKRCSQRVLDRLRVKAMAPHCYAAQLHGSGEFIIVRVDMATAKDGRADAVVVSASFASEAEAWTDALVRMTSGGADNCELEAEN